MVPTMASAIAPVVPVVEVNAGPTITHPLPLYTFNCVTLVSHQKSPVFGSVGAAVPDIPAASFVHAGASILSDELTLRAVFALSHHNCPGTGRLGCVPLAKFSNK